MRLKQITVRPSLDEYLAFQSWVIANGNGDFSESSALCELLSRFFDGGQRRELSFRIKEVSKQIESLSTIKNT
jgi:hypothetical protein